MSKNKDLGVHGESMISTNKGYKLAKDIKHGDVILTHKNQYQKVLQVSKNKAKSKQVLRVLGSFQTIVASEQKFYVIERKKIWDKNLRKQIWTYSNPQWIHAKDLKPKSHIIGFSHDPNEGNPLNITLEEAFLLGRYVADGFIVDTKRPHRKNSYNNKVIFAIGENKLDEFLNRVKTYHVGKTKDKTVYKCYIINKRFKDLCSLFGRGALNKKIYGGIFASNQEIQYEFLQGYWSGDGSVRGNEYRANSISKELIYGLGRLIFQVHGLSSSIGFTVRPKTTIIEGRVVNQRDTWSIAFRKNPKKRYSFTINNMLWCPVLENVTFTEDTEFYDFKVEKDNSYTVFNMIAKGDE